MARRVVLFDVGGPIDMEFAYEIAVEGAIAAACGMEGVRVDQAAIDEASERAVEAFASDAYAHMIEALCGDPGTVARVHHRVRAMVANLDVFQLRPGIDDLLRKLRKLDLRLGLASNQSERVRGQLERVGIGTLFDRVLDVAPAECILVGDRLDTDIAPAKALGMATIRFRTGRHRRQKPRWPEETPDVEVTDVPELEAAIRRAVH